MTRPLRQRHRAMIGALGALLPVAFIFGLAAPKPVPTMALPRLLPGETPRVDSVRWDRDDLWTQPALRTRLVTDQVDRRAIELRAKDAVIRPDVLVYWIPGESKPDQELPPAAILLGAFNGHGTTPLRLPPQAAGQGGLLVLYSLAEQEIIAASKPFTP